jgi:TP901 family phage tail tape measure protein
MGATTAVSWLLELKDKMTSPLKSLKNTTETFKKSFVGLKNDLAKINTTSINDLNKELDELYERRGKASLAGDLREINKEIEVTERKLEHLNNAGRSKPQQSSLGNLKSQLMDAIPGAELLTNPIVLGATALGFATNKAKEFDHSMAEINSTLLLSKSELSQLGDKVIAAGKGTGTADIEEAANAYKFMASAGMEGEAVLTALPSVLKASSAGFTESTVVANALTGVMANFPAGAISATRALDVLFAATNAGKVEFKDLATYMPQLLPNAKALGFGFEELAGTYATLTKAGVGSAESATLIGNAFTALGRGETLQRMQKEGILPFDSAGKMRPMVSIIGDLKEKMKGMNDIERSSFLEKIGLTDAQAKTFFNIAIGNFETLKEVVGQTTDATVNGMGYMEATFQNTGDATRDFQNTQYVLGETMRDIGKASLPALVSGMRMLGGILQWTRDNGRALTTVAIGLGTAWAFYNGITLISNTVTGIKNGLLMISAIRSLGAAGAEGVLAAMTGNVTLAQLALNAAMIANPIGLVIAAIAGLVAGLIYAYNHFEKFRAVVDGVFSFIRTYVIGIIKYFGEAMSAFGQLIEAVKNGEWAKAAAAGGKIMLAFSPVGLVDAALKSGVQSASAFSKGYDESLAKSQSAKKQESGGKVNANSSPETVSAKSPMELLNERQNAKGAKFDLKEDKEKGGKGNTISGGISGEKPRIVNLVIQKLEIMANPTFNNIQQAKDDVKREMTDFILSVFNDASIAAE